MNSRTIIKNARFFSIAAKQKAAGILFVCLEDDTVFLQKRSKKVDHPGFYATPGGGVEKGEDFWEAAVREIEEELGSMPKIKQVLDTKVSDGKVYYVTFICEMALEEKKKWEPKINHESDEAKWFSAHKLPSPLLPEFKKALDL